MRKSIVVKTLAVALLALLPTLIRPMKVNAAEQTAYDNKDSVITENTTTVPELTIKSTDGPSQGTYKEVMSTALAKFYIKAQPNDAVPLDTNLVLDEDDLGKYEGRIYFNLPRLKNQYYYKIVNESPWGIYDTWEYIYPSLSLSNGYTSAAGTIVELDIVSSINEKSVAHCKVTVLPQLTGKTLGTPVPMPSNLWEDSGRVNDKIHMPTGSLNAYNPALHKYAYVTESSVFFDPYIYPSEDLWINEQILYNCTTDTITLLDSSVMDVNSYVLKDAVTHTAFNSYVNEIGGDLKIKPFCLSSEGGIFVIRSSDYNTQTGVLHAGASPEASYMFVSNDGIIVHEYNATAEDQENFQMTLQQGYSYTYNELTKGYLANIGEDAFQFYPSTCKYTARTGNPMTLTLCAPGLTTLPFVMEMNGVGGDRPVNPPIEDKDYYTVRFDYTGGLRSSYKDVVPGVDPELPTPTKSGYTFEGWYVDPQLTTEYDYRTFNYVVGGSYTLYAKFKLIGSYTVRFYDDKNGTDKSSTFSLDDLPTLPSAPTYTGYVFKNWLIVDNTASTTGTFYDPETFKPNNGDSYIFKAAWDVSGVIISVTANQKEYWVGDTIDKSKIVVLVQTDSNGTTKTLSTGEFTVIPDKIEKVGTNSITIRYDATGATATIDLTGKQDYITGISAVYKGEDLEVGNTIPTGSIEVKLAYKSGKVVPTKEFSINPSTVRAAGTNTITITSSGYSTSITVNGKKKVVDGTANGGKGKLSNISASYTGNQLYVGDNIPDGSIKVTARFSDGTTAIVSNGDFTFSPSFIRNAGSNSITVSYQDKTATVNIVGKEKSSLENNNVSSTKDTGSTGTISGGSGSTGYNGTSSQGYSGTGTGSTDVNEKGTSVGYLNGKNILDSLGGGTSSTITNDVDIMLELSEAQANAESVNVSLINTAEGNYLTPDMVRILMEKELDLNVTMLSPKDKSTRVALWQFSGASLKETDNYLDLNISFEQVPKSNETMYHISVFDYPYQNSMVCGVSMRDAYASGTFVNYYSCDYALKNSNFLSNMTWSSSMELLLPLLDSSDFVVTDYVEQRPSGSDLLAEIEAANPVDEVDMPVDDSESDEDDWSDFDWGDDEVDVKPTSNTGGKVKGFVLISVAIVIAVIIAVAVVYLLKRRSSYDSYDEDEIPEYEGDLDEEYEEEELDDISE